MTMTWLLIASRSTHSLSQKSDCYVELAKAVLGQWVKDGKPDDFSFTNIHDLEQGTFYDFWETVLFELQRDISQQEADSVYNKITRGDINVH